MGTLDVSKFLRPYLYQKGMVLVTISYNETKKQFNLGQSCRYILSRKTKSWDCEHSWNIPVWYSTRLYPTQRSKTDWIVQGQENISIGLPKAIDSSLDLIWNPGCK